ncbi:MAG: alpha-amylase family glycosyl hydrolase [Verrucomicrobiota bacterium JB023]|nr:alpha-amylase family glycosyl hydrolase [Verrucomicrobiota bacterium JB023]
MATIEFKLFAPYNKEAALLADFTDWEPAPMSKGDDGHFRLETELEDGRYLYRFRVASKSWFHEENQLVEVTDPYAFEVVDDEYQNGVIEIRDGQQVTPPQHEWQHDGKPLPGNQEIIIYELLVHDFSGEAADAGERGTFAKVRGKLDYLRELGINAVELLPIGEYPGRDGWGYNPRHFFATESSYGGAEELARLIDELHGAGIRVLKDGIYNHAEASSPLAGIDHDYWFHHEPKDEEYHWGPEFNYQMRDDRFDVMPARQFIGRAVTHWIRDFHFDGLRLDAAAQIRDPEVLAWLHDEAFRQTADKPFLVVAEHIPDSPDLVQPDGPLDGCWHETFYNTVKNALVHGEARPQALMDVIDPRRRGYESGLRVINYLANHDHPQLMAELGQAGITGEAAFRRARLGAILLLTSMGIPLIWCGEEFGDYRDKVLEANPVHWDLLENEPNQELHALYKGLIQLRRTNGALQGSHLDFFHLDEELPLIAFVRWNDEGSRVVVIANFSDQFLADYLLDDFPADGTWKDWVNGHEIEVEQRKLSLDISEWEARVLVI